MAISSSTTSRSRSRSEKEGASSISMRPSMALGSSLSTTRPYRRTYSLDVAALTSPPSTSNAWAISLVVYRSDPLNRRCSMKCVIPARFLGSSRDPTGIQKPRHTERMDHVRSVCLGFWISVGSRDEPRNLAGITHFMEHLLFKGSERYTTKEIAPVSYTHLTLPTNREV